MKPVADRGSKTDANRGWRVPATERYPMKWTFKREAEWMLWFELIPAALIAWAILWPALQRLFGS